MGRTDKIYTNGLSLPRLGKAKYSKLLVTNELWKQAIAENPEFKGMKYREFLEIWEAIATTFKETIIENPLGLKAPFFIGEWKVQHLPYRPKTQDYKASEEVAKKIPFLNLHTKGKTGKLIWERKSARRYNRALDLYAFEPLQQGFRDEVSKALQRNPERYRVARPKSINKR
jgi:hypothetical protein